VRRWARRHPVAIAAVLLLAAALTAGLGTALAGGQSAAERDMQRGQAAYKEGRYPEAAEAFSAVLRADASRTDALLARGRAYQQLGENDPKYFGAAAGDFGAADEQAPDGRAKAGYAYCLNRQGNLPGAILQYREALRANFENAAVWNNLAYSYLKRGEYESAQEAVARALQLDPRLQAAYHNRALALLPQAHRLRQRCLRAAAKPTAGDKLTQARADLIGVLRHCLEDMHRALELGPPSAELYLDAARFHALLAQEQPGPEARAACLEWLAKAARLGCKPVDIEQDRVFGPLRDEPRFQDILRQCSSPPGQPPAPRLVDPLGGEQL
jgi:tetratricopeptide (TPR) repeat protein